MKLLKWFKDIIDSDSSVSSKRFCGVLGWLACVAVLLYCTIKCIQAPLMIDVFLLSVVGLLGVDSVTNIWKTPKPPREIEEGDEEDDDFERNDSDM